MMTRRMLAVAAVLVVSGCAGTSTTTGNGMTAGDAAPGALPTLTRPTAPPDDPTDLIKPGWLVGTVTTGGSGPCYGLTTDEGVDFALHSAAGTKLIRGTRIRVRTKAALVRIYCGPGQLVEMTAVQPVG